MCVTYRNSFEVNWVEDMRRDTPMIPFVSSYEPAFKYVDDFLILCKLWLFLDHYIWLFSTFPTSPPAFYFSI